MNVLLCLFLGLIVPSERNFAYVPSAGSHGVALAELWLSKMDDNDPSKNY